MFYFLSIMRLFLWFIDHNNDTSHEIIKFLFYMSLENIWTEIFHNRCNVDCIQHENSNSRFLMWNEDSSGIKQLRFLSLCLEKNRVLPWNEVKSFAKSTWSILPKRRAGMGCEALYSFSNLPCDLSFLALLTNPVFQFLKMDSKSK